MKFFFTLETTESTKFEIRNDTSIEVAGKVAEVEDEVAGKVAEVEDKSLSSSVINFIKFKSLI